MALEPRRRIAESGRPCLNDVLVRLLGVGLDVSCALERAQLGADFLRGSTEEALTHLQRLTELLLAGYTIDPKQSREVARWFRSRYVRVSGFPCVAQDRRPCSVSTSRSSNRTGGFPASGSRTRNHPFAHGKLFVRAHSRTSPNFSYRYWSGNRYAPRVPTACFRQSH